MNGGRDLDRAADATFAPKPPHCELCAQPVEENDDQIPGLWGPVHTRCAEKVWEQQEAVKVND